MPSPRRLNDADANFAMMGRASGTTCAPLGVTVYERPYDDPGTYEHLIEAMSRLLPAMRRRIVRDPFSPALPRWEDVPGFDPRDHLLVLPAPGDGSLRAVLDWAERWSGLPLDPQRPQWRVAHFTGVTVDGVSGRMVRVAQLHHAIVDGEGGQELSRHLYRWSPDDALPELPPPVEPDGSRPVEQWRAGWALEGAKARGLVRETRRRIRRMADDPTAGMARARELGAAALRLRSELGALPQSPLLRRTSNRNRFDTLRVDLDAVRSGARALGASANDGFMAATSLALHRWHLDHGIKLAEVRLVMPISTRAAASALGGNELIGAVMGLPLLDDAAQAVKASQVLSRSHRDDADALRILDRLRAAGNRPPAPIVSRVLDRAQRGIDLTISNVRGAPRRNWVAGVEVLETFPFLIGGPAVAITLQSGPTHAGLGMVTCPEAVTDPEHLIRCYDQGFREVAALAG